MAFGSPVLNKIVLIAGDLASDLRTKFQSLEHPPETIASLSERPHWLTIIDNKVQCGFEAPPSVVINLLPTSFTGKTQSSIFEQSEHDAANWALLVCHPGIVLNRPDSELGLAPARRAVTCREPFFVDRTLLARVRYQWATPACAADLIELELGRLIDLLVQIDAVCAN